MKNIWDIFFRMKYLYIIYKMERLKKLINVKHILGYCLGVPITRTLSGWAQGHFRDPGKLVTVKPLFMIIT